MGVAPANSERVDANTLAAVSWPRYRLYRYNKSPFLEGNCEVSVRAEANGSGDWMNLLLGFGVLNLICGGITRFSRDSTALIKLVMPEAPSE
jgi:hypothetical protein